MKTNGKTSKRAYTKIAWQYAADVISGKVDACRWIKLACERHMADVKHGQYVYDAERANEACGFIERMPHIKGRWPTRNIVLEPWQCFAVCSIFGWVDELGARRYRSALIVIPRKNGKSLLAAAIGLYLLAHDGEPGAEIYSAATTRDQAKISWELARKMAQRSPGFTDRFGVEPLAHSIAVESNAAFFKPLSRDADSLEGLNPHGVIIDELHAHKTREVFDVMDEASGARRQPLKFIISTEGDDAQGVFAEQVKYLQDVLEGTHQDENYFGLYYSIDPEDDWTQEGTWRKANPNYSVSVGADEFGQRCKRAMHSPASQASFLTKRLNVRVGAGDAFFNMLAWGNCKEDGLNINQFAGERCYITLDLASKWDLSAKVMLFRRGGKYYAFSRCYLPASAIVPGAPNYDRYRGWLTSGALTSTPGNVTDYEFIERDLLDDLKRFRVRFVGYDPYQATQFSTRMTAQGAPMVEVPATVKNFSEAMKSLGALIISGKLCHDGDPVLSWAIGNVVAKIDAKENVYPRKAREENKIDPAVALIAGMRLYLAEEQTANWDFKVIGL